MQNLSLLAKFLEQKFQLREKTSHKIQCEEVEKDKTGEKSKEYGINRNSVLNELAYFHVCSGALVPDVMHDILEGALQYEIKLMLQVMMRTECYFPLSTLNTNQKLQKKSQKVPSVIVPIHMINISITLLTTQPTIISCPVCNCSTDNSSIHWTNTHNKYVVPT